jgi:mannonate dehydratase
MLLFQILANFEKTNSKKKMALSTYKTSRRKFFKTSSLAALVPISGQYSHQNYNTRRGVGWIKDAGMIASEAYFDGIKEPKISLMKQMEVFGAVGGVNLKVAGLEAVPSYELKTIQALKAAWKNQGLEFNVVEGPPCLTEKTKLGLTGRDEEIAQFIILMKSLIAVGIDVICYNWMPIVGWYRTDKAKPGRGGALVTSFDERDIPNTPLTTHGFVSKETMWKNLDYFLRAVIPEAEKIGMKLAMHPDDPQIDQISGISRIMTSVENFKRLIEMYPSPNNGITFCQGNFSLMGTNLIEAINYFGKRKLIHFVHFRNVRDLSGKKPSTRFDETFHDEGDIDMYAAMNAYYQVGFKGPIRPDHVPTMAGDSNDFPGYSTIGSLFAWGYIKGLMEGVQKKRME